MIIKWYQTLTINQKLTNSDANITNKNVLFWQNKKLYAKIPLSLLKGSKLTKTYFWFLFLLGQKKPQAHRYITSAAFKKYNQNTNLAGLKDIVTVVKGLNLAHFLYFFFQFYKSTTFKSRKKILKLYHTSIIFKLSDVSYPTSFLKTKLIKNFDIYSFSLNLNLLMRKKIVNREFIDMFLLFNYYSFKNSIKIKR